MYKLFIHYIYTMKAGRIYLLKFTSKPNIGDDLDHPVYKELSSLLDTEDQKYIGFNEKEDMFIRLLDYKVDKVCDILNKNGFVFIKNDITEEVIRGEAQIKYPEVNKLTPQLFENFRLENTSIDNILDKINLKGIKSLDKIDLLILSNFSKIL